MPVSWLWVPQLKEWVKTSDFYSGRGEGGCRGQGRKKRQREEGEESDTGSEWRESLRSAVIGWLKK